MWNYSYIDKKKKTLTLWISDSDQKLVNQAVKDFDNSNKHIRDEEFFIWRWALQAYHLSTYNRKVQLWDKTRKQNISIWLIRSFVDILVSSLNEKPLIFTWTAINEKGLKHKDNILNTLWYISDVSWFHKQLKDTMANGLIIWEIAMRISWLGNKTSN